MATAIIYAPSGGSTSMFEIAIPATANYGALSVGLGPWDGLSAGHFAGNAAGTLIAGNAASSFAGNLLDLQVNGSSKFSINYFGSTTQQGSLNLANNSGIGLTGTITRAGSGIGVISFPSNNSIVIYTTSTTVPPLLVQGASSQTADIQQWNINGGAALSGVNLRGEHYMPRLLSTLTGGGAISQGSGVPTSPNGQNPTAGDVFLRTDTPSTANQRLYICTVGGATPTWVGII